MHSAASRKTQRRNRSAGFTLIELLVVVVIILALTVLAFTVVNSVTKGDKITGSSRQVQAFLEGARDRALHAGQPRGVRFQFDSNNPNMVRSMVYIGPAGKLSEGTIRIGRAASGMTPAQPRWITDASGGPNLPSSWRRLADTSRPIDKQLIFNGARLRLDRNFYTIIRDSGSPSGWSLTRDFIGTPGTPFNATNGDWDLQLAPSILPNQEPQPLPQGVVIDMNPAILANRVGLPATWLNNPRRRDIMFSPRGTIVGAEASAGHIHLLIGSLVDADQNRAPGDPTKEDGEVIVTITTQTGSVSSHSVRLSGDPFRYAESGVETE